MWWKPAQLFCLTVLLMLSGNSANSQCTHPTQRAQVTVSDMNGWNQALWFGVHINATYGLDMPLCEFEWPPVPPTGVFDARFTNIPGREGWEPPDGMGQGFMFDYRVPLSSAQIDTHRIRFHGGEPLPGYPIKFKWSSSEVRTICDSALLRDPFGGLIVNTRMDLVDSVLVQNQSLSQVLIIRFGNGSASGVGPVSGIVPERFGLKQNYPNPFNPETIIRFDLPTAQFVSLRVYNVVGQEVATVVEKDLAAGEYALTFSAGRYGLSSGVYYYRIAAGPFAATKRMILVR